MSSATTTPRIRALLRQADKAAAASKKAAASQMYRQIISEAPDTTAAWLGLASVTAEKGERETAYQKVLDIDPGNEAAKNGLAILQGLKIEKPRDEPGLEEEASPATDDGQRPGELSPSTSVEAHPEDHRHLSEAELVEQHDDHVPLVSDTKTVCANHPNRETNLRCNRCGKPICSQCAVPTPVGYRCTECIREFEDALYSATAVHYIIAGVTALVLSLITAWIVASILGFWVIFLAAFAGTTIGRIVFRVIGRRRGRWLPQTVAAIVIIAALIVALPGIVSFLFGRPSFGVVWIAIYAVIASGAAFYQMK